jgi:hypothetical protein
MRRLPPGSSSLDTVFRRSQSTRSVGSRPTTSATVPSSLSAFDTQEFGFGTRGMKKHKKVHAPRPPTSVSGLRRRTSVSEPLGSVDPLTSVRKDVLTIHRLIDDMQRSGTQTRVSDLGSELAKASSSQESMKELFLEQLDRLLCVVQSTGSDPLMMEDATRIPSSSSSSSSGSGTGLSLSILPHFGRFWEEWTSERERKAESTSKGTSISHDALLRKVHKGPSFSSFPSFSSCFIYIFAR